jgi:hypothetical protein
MYLSSSHPLFTQTIHLIPSHKPIMSFSESLTAPMRRKRTASERVTDNGDPLVIKKKAREAAKKNTQVFLFKN